MTYDDFVSWENRPRFVSPGVFTAEKDISVMPTSFHESDLGKEMAEVIDRIIIDRLIYLASE